MKKRNDNLLEYFRDGRLCDIKLCVEEKEIPAHKVVLSASSKFFEAMFCGSFPEAQKDVISLPSLSYNATRDILLFIYGDEQVLQSDNLELKSIREMEYLLSVANFLQIQEAMDKVVDTLKFKVNERNCFEILKFAHLYELKELEKKALGMINSQFGYSTDKIPLSNILNESHTLIAMLVSHDSLQASEDTIFSMCLSWIEYFPEERLVYAEELLQYIHLTLLTEELLQRGLELLSSVPFCEKKLREALEIKSNNLHDLVTDCAEQFRSEPSPFVLKRSIQSKASLRSQLHFRNPIFSERNVDYEEHHNQEVHLSMLVSHEVDSATNKVNKNMDVVSSTVRGFRDCEGKQTQSLFEEEPENLEIHAVVPRKKSNSKYWLNVGNTIAVYRHAAFITVNNFLFVAGGEKVVETPFGFCLRTVSEFQLLDPRSMKWKKLPNMSFARSRFALVQVENFIYAIGGRKGNFSCELRIERFDLKTLTWETVAQLETGIFENVACYNSKLNAIFTCYWKTTTDLLCATRSLDQVIPVESQSLKLTSLDLNWFKFKSYVLQGASLQLRTDIGRMTFFNDFLYLFQDTLAVRVIVEEAFCTETGTWSFEYDSAYSPSMFIKFEGIPHIEYPKIQGQTRSVFGLSKNSDEVCFLMNFQSLRAFKWHAEDCKSYKCNVHDTFYCHQCALYKTELIENAFNVPNQGSVGNVHPQVEYPFFHDEKSIEYCAFMAFPRELEGKANVKFEQANPHLGAEKCKKDFWDGFMCADDIPEYGDFYDGEDHDYDYEDYDDDEDLDEMFDMWMA